MPLLLHLTGDREIHLNVDPDEWKAAFENALSGNKAVEIEDPSDGGLLGINPRSILYWKVHSQRGSSDPAR